MSNFNMLINGQAVAAEDGETLLQAAVRASIAIPTLCHHEKLEPFGSCRLCSVEIGEGDRKKLVAACVYPAEADLVVTTRSEKIDRIRKIILELYLAHAPDSAGLRELAAEYGADRNRFEKEASFCIHCGLCVRYCAEVKKANAVGFIDRGTRKEICFVPHVAAKECWNCKECFPLCPTEALQAAYVLVEALKFPRENK